jgi:hypothetical protein
MRGRPSGVTFPETTATVQGRILKVPNKKNVRINNPGSIKFLILIEQPPLNALMAFIILHFFLLSQGDIDSLVMTSDP